MYLQYVKQGDRFTDKFIVIISLFSYIVFRTIIRIFVGKRRRNELMSKRGINLKNFVIADFVFNVNGLKYYAGKKYENFAFSVSNEPLVVKSITDILKNGDVFVDLGCNVGTYSLLASKLVGDNGKIISVDANPDNIEILKKNMKLNNVKNILPINLAVSDKNGFSEFYLTGKSGTGSLADQNLESFLKKIQIETKTLDNLLESINHFKEIKLIKIDIEGSEVDCIKEGMNVIKITKNFLIECHSTSNKLKIEKLLKESFSIKEIDYLKEFDTFHILCSK